MRFMAHVRDEMPLPDALGQSEAFLNFQERLSRVAVVDRPVLIVGERGTGKELAAKRLHFLSRRWQEPLVELNCAALSPTLIESELFGHEAGAFTGAARRRTGLFESADGGTLFLDELGNIPLPVQEKILRVVEYGVFQRVGGSETVRVDVRIVGATNADLPGLAREGRFMRDLLDRLTFEVLFLPPLRERAEDIPLLAAHFAQRMAVELGRAEAPEFSVEAMKSLLAHPWRGNIRELKNTVERAVYACPGDSIVALVFDPFQTPWAALGAGVGGSALESAPEGAVAMERTALARQFPLSFTDELVAFERGLLDGALREAQFNQRRAAELLGLSYHQFRGLYRKYYGARQSAD